MTPGTSRRSRPTRSSRSTRYLHPGATISSATVIESISDEKQTRLGPGYFVTWVTTYFDAGDEVVGRQRFRILKFKPEAAAT